MNAQPAWTPGPWNENGDYVGTANAEIADVGSWWGAADQVERDANAHLIAAAPELYEALRDAANALQHQARMVTEHGQSPELHAKQRALQEQADAAFAALAKARGETA